ncbi:MAGa4850 family ICE element protein [Metamycoplasma hominis]|uniref:MAGa4850 family ICE element protein n=1 Tax=Metamycoplasma hominis TaxID=2098 RepID=UPI0034A172AE
MSRNKENRAIWSQLTGEIYTEKDKWLDSIEYKGDSNFWNLYKNKIYLKLNEDKINEIFKWNILISNKIFELLKKSKLTFLVYLVIIKYSRKKWISKKFLVDFGFSRTSIILAINQLNKLNLILEKDNQIKISKKYWFKKGESYFKLHGILVWRSILLFPLEYLEKINLIVWKSKEVAKKSFTTNKSSSIKIQNNFLKMKKSCAYKFINSLLKILGQEKYETLFKVEHKFDKVSQKFITERTLLIRLNNNYAF